LILHVANYSIDFIFAPPPASCSNYFLTPPPPSLLKNFWWPLKISSGPLPGINNDWSLNTTAYWSYQIGPAFYSPLYPIALSNLQGEAMTNQRIIVLYRWWCIGWYIILGVTIARKVLPNPQGIKGSMRSLLNKGLFIWSCFAWMRCQAGLFWCIKINYCARFSKKLHS
jgi:hypothetical protein